MSIILDWIKNLFILIIAINFLEILLPDSSLAKYVKFIFSLIILAAILSPLSYLCNP